MKKADVKINETYRVKVSGNLVDVKITAENPRGGWDGLNLATGKTVRIKVPQRLREVATPRPASRRRIVTMAQHEAELAAEAAAPTEADDAPQAPPEADTGERAATGGEPDAVTEAVEAVGVERRKRASGLDAAVQVLVEAGEPLGTKQMMERMLAQGLWQTGGKTPANTLYSAILREINVKGDASRFRKVHRGRFEVVLPH